MGIADSTAAMKILFQGEDQTKAAAASVEVNTSRISKAALGVKAAWSVAGVAATTAAGFLGEAARAAADDAADTDRLRQAVENSGASWDDVSGKINDRIKSGQQLAFTDDQTRDSLSLLVAETGSLDEAMKRNALAMDLARGLNIDVGAASKLLGKVTDDNIKVLGRYGIHVDKVAVSEKDHQLALQAVATATLAHDKATVSLHDIQVKLHGRTKLTADEQIKLREAQKAVTDTTRTLAAAQDKANKTTQEGANQTALFEAVQKKFGGQAESYSHTTAAALFRAKDAFSEWKESVGAALGGAQPFVAMLPGISSGMTIAGAALGPVASGLLDVAKSERVAAIGSTLLNLALGPVGLIVLGIAAAVALLAFAWANNWGDIRGKTAAAITFIHGVISTVGPIIKQWVVDPMAAAVGFIRGHWGAIKAIIGDALGIISGLFRGDFGGVAKSAGDLFGRVASAITGIFKNIHIPMPHFAFKGNYNPADWVQGKNIPALSVAWYGKGGQGIATGPTLIGIGESGPEAFSVRPLGKGNPADDTAGGSGIDRETKELLRAQLRATQEQSFILRAILGSGGTVTPLAAARRLA